MSHRYWQRAWGLTEGCTPVSAACDHCWAAAATHMRQHQSNPKVRARYEGLTDAAGRFNGTVRMMWDDLEKPLAVKRPTVWSVWNDLFHETVPFDFINRAFDVMTFCKWHTFLVLSKRPERFGELLYNAPKWYQEIGAYPPNVWLGTTVERQEYVGRLDYLRPLAEDGWHIWVSCEPCLSTIDLRPWFPRQHYEEFPPGPNAVVDVVYDCGLSFVVVGAETGLHARPMELEWARLIARDCVNAGVPLFMKAVSGGGPIPPALDIRQLPWEPK